MTTRERQYEILYNMLVDAGFVVAYGAVWPEWADGSTSYLATPGTEAAKALLAETDLTDDLNRMNRLFTKMSFE